MSGEEKQNLLAGDAKPVAIQMTPLSPRSAAQDNLFWSAKENQTGKIRDCLDRGDNVNSIDYDGRTPLHIACTYGKLDAVKMLIEQGSANVNVEDEFKSTPLDDAYENGWNEITSYLKSKGAKVGSDQRKQADRLIQAAYLGDLNKAITILDGVSASDKTELVNCCDYDKRTPLHLAVSERKYEMAKFLMENGANKNAEDRWKLTPVDDAKKYQSRTGHDQFIALLVGEAHEHEPLFSTFSSFFVFLEIVLIILFAVCTTYGEGAAGGPGIETGRDAMRRYPIFMDVHVMIFIGFGYLMTFLRKNGYNSLGLTFLVAAFVIQIHILIGGFFHQAFAGHGFHQIKVGLDTLIFADFAAGAVLITYGVLLGKVSPFQLMGIAMFETVFFTINENIGLQMGVTDLGGSMVIHMFGAFFGLSASVFMKNVKALGNNENAAVYHSDMFAMVGTVFLWMFWPSFNGAMAEGNTQMRAVVNTVLSLAGSCVAGYVASYIFRKEKKFDMVDIQNATLAGGVAMGTCADLVVFPGPAILIGAAAGTVSVIGYCHVQAYLEEKIGLHDTCGVNNLHGMPSIIGAIAGIIVCSKATVEGYGTEQFAQIFGKMSITEDVVNATGVTNIFGAIADEDLSRTPADQAKMQLAFTCITLAISIVAGAFTAKVVNADIFEPLVDEDLFQDRSNWEVPSLENPYYYDKRGEIKRDDGTVGTVETRLEASITEIKEKLKKLQDSFHSQSATAYQKA